MNPAAHDKSTVTAAYDYCMRQARQHYENFPVASSWLPANLRPAIAVIYAFARQADDYADEGNLDSATRLRKLDECDAHLSSLGRGETPDEPLYIALQDVIRRYQLPPGLFHDLVSAFRQDVTTTRYQDFAAILDYCRRSANPVGRLLLHLAGAASEENCHLSDNICTALQLANFYQDLVQDYVENGRIYLALDEMDAAGVSERHIVDRRNDPAMHAFMHAQYRRAALLLCSGLPLTRRLGWRLGLEIRATVQGGLRVLELLRQSDDIYCRPRLGKIDWLCIILRTLIPNRACSSFPS